MIVASPTGLYKEMFSWESSYEEAQDNITWYVSSNEPPYILGDFATIPVGQKLRSLPDRVHTTKSRRKSLGELIFTTESAGYDDLLSGKFQFETGQTLTLDDISDIDTLSIPKSQDMSVRHNANVLDISSYVDSQDKLSSVLEEANVQLQALHKELNEYRSSVTNVEHKIQEVQKSINEVNKSKEAMDILQSQGVDIGTLDTELDAKLTNLQNELTSLESQHSTHISNVNTTRDKIRQLSQVVR
jgi:chromosome segregation ATPase